MVLALTGALRFEVLGELEAHTFMQVLHTADSNVGDAPIPYVVLLVGWTAHTPSVARIVVGVPASART